MMPYAKYFLGYERGKYAKNLRMATSVFEVG